MDKLPPNSNLSRVLFSVIKVYKNIYVLGKKFGRRAISDSIFYMRLYYGTVEFRYSFDEVIKF